MVHKCFTGYNSDTITELERKCRRLQTQVFQMEVQWNTVFLPTPPPPTPTPNPTPVYTTTSLLQPYSFDRNVKTTESFCYFEYLVNATILLLQSGFYCPMVVASTGFHCSGDMILAEIKKICFFTQLQVSFSYGMPTSSHMFMLRL